jgi:hypothetical protein
MSPPAAKASIAGCTPSIAASGEERLRAMMRAAQNARD